MIIFNLLKLTITRFWLDTVSQQHWVPARNAIQLGTDHRNDVGVFSIPDIGQTDEKLVRGLQVSANGLAKHNDLLVQHSSAIHVKYNPAWRR